MYVHILYSTHLLYSIVQCTQIVRYCTVHTFYQGQWASIEGALISEVINRTTALPLVVFHVLISFLLFTSHAPVISEIIPFAHKGKFPFRVKTTTAPHWLLVQCPRGMPHTLRDPARDWNREQLSKILLILSVRSPMWSLGTSYTSSSWI